MRQTADLLEKMAEAYDRDEQQRVAQVTQERTKTAQDLREKIARITGEDVPVQTVERMVASGQDVTALITKMAGHSTLDEAPDSMGSSRDIREANANSRDTREKTASEDADARMYNWVMN